MTTKTATNKATIDTKELYEALQKVNSIKTRREPPILSNTLVEIADGKATLTATDLERVIKIELDSTHTESFSMLLPRKLTAKFSYGGNGKMSVTQGKTPRRVTLSREGIGDVFLTVPSTTDFPPIPKPENLEWHTLDGKWFCSMLHIVAQACADERERPVLNGVCINDGAIASADGFRLVVLKDNRLAFGLGDKQVIIPLDTVTLIVKLFSKEDALEVAFETARRIYIKSNNVTLTSQLIQGTYPQYQNLIPNSFGCKVSFSSPLLLQRLNMIDPIVINSLVVRYVFEALETKEQVCSISATIEDEDKYHLSCPIMFKGHEAKIAFNYKYMLEALKPFSICDLEITSPSSPGKLTGDIEGLTIVIMPMFVQW